MELDSWDSMLSLKPGFVFEDANYLHQMPESHTTEPGKPTKLALEVGVCWSIQPKTGLRTMRLKQGSQKGPLACCWDSANRAADFRTLEEEMTCRAESDTSF